MADTRSVDVAVVGGGPAGLAAAIEAANGGARVIVIDQSPALGGQIWRHRSGMPPAVPRRAARMFKEFEATGSERLVGATVIDAQPGELRVVADDGPVRIRTHAIVLATGARERFLPFPGWTLPNVFGVGGLQALIKSGLELQGKRIVVAGTGPLLFPVAATAAAHGAHVVLVAEQASPRAVVGFASTLWRSPSKLLQAARYRSAFVRTPFRAGAWIARAEGQGIVDRVVVTDGRREWPVRCDIVATAAGLIPNIEVGILIGCRTAGGALVANDEQLTTVGGVFAAGECTGVGGEDLAIVEGMIAGLAAVNRAHAHLHRRRTRLRSFANRMESAFAPRNELLRRPDAETIVCRCEDVRWGALRPEWGARQAKLATRAGMGACQGRICGAALECLLGWEPAAVRPPLAPASVASLADFDADE